MLVCRFGGFDLVLVICWFAFWGLSVEFACDRDLVGLILVVFDLGNFLGWVGL